MIRSPNTEDEVLGDGIGILPGVGRCSSTRNLSNVRGTACLPHHQSTSKAVDAARLISKAVHSITDDDWRTLTSPSGFAVESSAIETLPTTPLRKWFRLCQLGRR